MSLQVLKVNYPDNKNIAGAAWWKVIHNISANYPMNPTNKDKQDAKAFFDYLINNFVCIECVSHAKEYLVKNPINLESKVALTKYFEDIHNFVNQKLGKPQFAVELNNDTHFDNSTCTTCHVQEHQELKNNLADFKTNARNIILTLCKEAQVPPPNVHFQPCPDNTSTSCLTYDSTRMNNEGAYVGDADIFINPYSASLRTIKHEAKHYINLKTGGSLGEIEADNYAIEKINSHFNFDSYKNEMIGNNKLMDIKDVNDNNVSLLPQQKDVFDTLAKRVKYDNISSTPVSSDYPSLERINSMLDRERQFSNKPLNPGNPPETNVYAIENNRDEDFILSSLNGIFAWPASLVGVSPASLNMTYTGGFITKVISYIISSNFSIFGASVINFLSAVSLFSGAAIFKNSIGMGDRGVIQGMVAMFLLSGVDALVPKKREVMGEGLRLLIEGVKEFDFEKIKQSFFLDDEAFLISKSVDANKKKKVDNAKVANALAATLGEVPKASMNVSPNRAMQLGSRTSFDSVNKLPTNYMSGEKNTIPNYSNSSLESIANAYARKRNPYGMGSGTLGNLEGLDINSLTNELNEIADMDVDENSYEILQMN